MTKKIVGYRKFTSKKGLPTCAVYLQEEFSNTEIENSTAHKGIKADTVMLFGDDANIINDVAIGKELVGYFGYYKGSLSVQSPAVK